MGNEDLIRYGLNHGDAKVRELAEQFERYRNLALRFVGSKEPVKLQLNSLYGKFGGETSGEVQPMYASKR